MKRPRISIPFSWCARSPSCLNTSCHRRKKYTASVVQTPVSSHSRVIHVRTDPGSTMDENHTVLPISLDSRSHHPQRISPISSSPIDVTDSDSGDIHYAPDPPASSIQQRIGSVPKMGIDIFNDNSREYSVDIGRVRVPATPPSSLILARPMAWSRAQLTDPPVSGAAVIRTVFVGPACSGKSELVAVLSGRQFGTIHQATVVADTTLIMPRTYSLDRFAAPILLTDTSGVARIAPCIPALLASAHVVCIFVDLTSETGDQATTEFWGQLRKYISYGTSRIVIGAKADAARPDVANGARVLAMDIGCNYIKTSARVGVGLSLLDTIRAVHSASALV